MTMPHTPKVQDSFHILDKYFSVMSVLDPDTVYLIFVNILSSCNLSVVVLKYKSLSYVGSVLRTSSLDST